jgi:hypothetical protein
MRSSARPLLALVLLVLVGPIGCPRRHPPPPRPAAKPEPPAPAPVDSSVSDVATGGSWQEGGRSGVFRVVVRSGGRRNLRSEVVLQWLEWSNRAEQPVGGAERHPRARAAASSSPERASSGGRKLARQGRVATRDGRSRRGARCGRFEWTLPREARRIDARSERARR